MLPADKAGAQRTARRCDFTTHEASIAQARALANGFLLYFCIERGERGHEVGQAV